MQYFESTATHPTYVLPPNSYGVCSVHIEWNAQRANSSFDTRSLSCGPSLADEQWCSCCIQFTPPWIAFAMQPLGDGVDHAEQHKKCSLLKSDFKDPDECLASWTEARVSFNACFTSRAWALGRPLNRVHCLLCGGDCGGVGASVYFLWRGQTTPWG